MTRPIEAVVAEALRRLESTGSLDIDALARAYPEHASELRELLSAMIRINEEKRWAQVETQSRSYAEGLFALLSPVAAVSAAAPPPAVTIGDLFRRELEAGGSVADQARRTGLPATAIERLAQEPTPAENLDNHAIKQLASRVAAPFALLAKEIRRLLALESLSLGESTAIFTRDSESSTEAERAALVQRVQLASGRSEPQPAQGETCTEPGEQPASDSEAKS